MGLLLKKNNSTFHNFFCLDSLPAVFYYCEPMRFNGVLKNKSKIRKLDRYIYTHTHTYMYVFCVCIFGRDHNLFASNYKPCFVRVFANTIF